ncbi:MAG: Flp family type IVb pilin [Pseudomonadota bacterium]
MTAMILTNVLKQLGGDQKGATAVEYALIVSLIVIAAVGAFQAVANENTSMWGNVMDASNKAQGS